jgi:hypothetical protein
MARIGVLLGLVWVVATGAFGSTMNPSTYSLGTTFGINGLGESVKPSTLPNLTITATVGGVDSTCTWTTKGANTECDAANFTVTFKNNNDMITEPWVITNTSSGSLLSSILFDGLGSTLFAFNPCNANGPGGTSSGSNCLTATSTAGGNAGVSGTALYTNALHITGQAGATSGNVATWNTFGAVLVSFGSGFGSASSSNSFSFLMDVDTITGPLVADSSTPEPSTIGLLGAGLLVIGIVGVRRRRTTAIQ